MVLLWATFLISNGNNSIACNFARFATSDLKRLKSCHWKQTLLTVAQHKLNVKTV